MAFAAEAKAAAQKTEQAIKMHALAVSPHSEPAMLPEWESLYLNPTPNETECAFCRALPTCPAARRALEDAVGNSFDLVAEPGFDQDALDGVAQADPAALGKLMAITGFLEDWIKAVRAETERRLLLEIPVEGYGLELGRQGARAWVSKDRAEEMIRKQFRVKAEDAYDMSLKSPTQIEKLAVPPKRKKGDDTPPPKMPLTPRQWAKLQDLIGRSDPKPSVKPVGQIKTPYVIAKPNADDFDEVPESLGQLEDDTPLY
jgi:hypothetical protein